MSSTKAMTGHALGAAGGIEAAFCVAALREGFLPASLHVSDPEPGLDLVRPEARPASIRHALSNSFGFGGSNASVILSRP